MSGFLLDPIELVKDHGQMLFRDPASCIRDVHLDMPIVHDLGTDTDATACWRKLDRILESISEHFVELVPVRANFWHALHGAHVHDDRFPMGERLKRLNKITQ